MAREWVSGGGWRRLGEGGLAGPGPSEGRPQPPGRMQAGPGCWEGGNRSKIEKEPKNVFWLCIVTFFLKSRVMGL